MDRPVQILLFAIATGLSRGEARPVVRRRTAQSPSENPLKPELAVPLLALAAVYTDDRDKTAPDPIRRFGRELVERLRRDSVPGLRIPSGGLPREDELALDSDACRFDVEWHLHRPTPK